MYGMKYEPKSCISEDQRVRLSQSNCISRILVALLRKRVKLCNSVIEYLLNEMARAIGTFQNLIIEYREVEGKSKVCWRQFSDSNIGGGGSAIATSRMLVTVSDGTPRDWDRSKSHNRIQRSLGQVQDR
jgi:hypothetical protein